MERSLFRPPTFRRSYSVGSQNRLYHLSCHRNLTHRSFRHPSQLPALSSRGDTRSAIAPPRITYEWSQTPARLRTLATSTMSIPEGKETSSTRQGAGGDWSPDQYLLFRANRDRVIHDLIAFFERDYAPERIVDLGCGPGNSTEILKQHFPNAQKITGVDSSPAMLAKARQTLPDVEFLHADVRTYEPEPGTDLLFANAVFQWVRRAERIPAITRLLRTLPPARGVLALQMPDNYDEPSHRAMREAAAAPGPWRAHFEALPAEDRPERDPLEPVMEYYNALTPHCRAVELWTTHYQHVLDGHGQIVEWVKGTGLQPFMNALPEGEVREAFLAEYRRRLERAYPTAEDGKVLLAYPRRFVVAFR
ncbi:hypothetical protein VTK56DRAFT_5829 [Thermocarpiscus australiensis]